MPSPARRRSHHRYADCRNGGTGRTGRLLVEKARASGHDVRILARQPSKAAELIAGLETKQGDVLDAQAVKTVIDSVDAVICLHGSPLLRPGRAMSDGTRNIVQAMQGTGVRRLVLVSADGAGETRSQLPLTVRLGSIFTNKFMAEKEEQERIVRESGLDWTLVRPGQLTDGPLTDEVAISREGRKVIGKVSRSDLASFLLKQVADPSSIRHSPQLFAKN
jgi:uncharacterized protein YbjT (DUF2867 family)